MHDLERLLSLPDDAMFACLSDYLEAQVDELGLVGLTAAERVAWQAVQFEVARRQGGYLAVLQRFDATARPSVVKALAAVGAQEAAAALSTVTQRSEHEDGLLDVFAERVAALDEDVEWLLCRWGRVHLSEPTQ